MGFSAKPPSHVWDNIQGQLAAQRRKQQIVLFSRVAAAAVIILAFLAGWYFSENTGEITPAVTQTESKSQNSRENKQNEVVVPNSGTEEKISHTESESNVAEIQNNSQIQNTLKGKKVKKSTISENETGNFIADAGNQQSISSEFSESASWMSAV